MHAYMYFHYILRFSATQMGSIILRRVLVAETISPGICIYPSVTHIKWTNTNLSLLFLCISQMWFVVVRLLGWLLTGGLGLEPVLLFFELACPSLAERELKG